MHPLLKKILDPPLCSTWRCVAEDSLPASVEVIFSFVGEPSGSEYERPTYLNFPSGQAIRKQDSFHVAKWRNEAKKSL